MIYLPTIALGACMGLAGFAWGYFAAPRKWCVLYHQERGLRDEYCAKLRLVVAVRDGIALDRDTLLTTNALLQEANKRLSFEVVRLRNLQNNPIYKKRIL